MDLLYHSWPSRRQNLFFKKFLRFDILYLMRHHHHILPCFFNHDFYDIFEHIYNAALKFMSVKSNIRVRSWFLLSAFSSCLGHIYFSVSIYVISCW